MFSKSRSCKKNGLLFQHKFNAYYLLTCRYNLNLNVFLCRPTVTLYQGQGIQNEHEHIICHAEYDRHATFECQRYYYCNTCKTFAISSTPSRDHKNPRHPSQHNDGKWYKYSLAFDHKPELR